ncbi:DUF3298 domain-containing protein [Patiriisocius sp. Uisw_017]|jgi:hypothetical protein|uniref:DUF3298 and DUF4163 domain-containing protein n=1 Tax=Patiriisocius sp. Uisw_017 TaxID=3230968 RepID=UPI0039EC0494
MINKYFRLFLISALLLSCSETLDIPISERIDEASLTECKTAACPVVSVAYIHYEGEPKLAGIINDSISHYIISALNLGDPESPATASNPTEAIQEFIKNYWRDTSEFPETNEYEAEIVITENFRNEAFISISKSQYKYIGGAHGYGSLSFSNFNIETGKPITTRQLLNDRKGFTAFAEKKLKEAYQISENESINSTGFWFENDTFYLPSTIGFIKNRVLIHYNIYEVASYAAGPIEVEISLEEAAPFMKYKIIN